MRVPPGVHVELERLYTAVEDRKFTEAERILQRIEEAVGGFGEEGRGYVDALRGIISARRSGDPQALVNRMERSKLRKYIKEFGALSKDSLKTLYERGFYRAWRDYLKAVSKLGLGHV